MTQEQQASRDLQGEAYRLYHSCHRTNGERYLQEFYVLYQELLQSTDDGILRRSVVFHVFAGSTPPETGTGEFSHLDLLLLERVREIHERLSGMNVSSSKSTPQTALG